MPTAALTELTSRVVGAPGVRAAASVEVSLGKLARQAERQAEQDEQLRQLTNMPLPASQITLNAGAGVLNVSNLYGPNDGFAWDVRYVVLASFTAGTVTVYNSIVNDENIVGVATAAGILRWGGDLVLNDTEYLVFSATGITGAVSVSGRVNQMPVTIEPKYLL